MSNGIVQDLLERWHPMKVREPTLNEMWKKHCIKKGLLPPPRSERVEDFDLPNFSLGGECNTSLPGGFIVP
jgi:hypothetical protein